MAAAAQMEAQAERELITHSYAPPDALPPGQIVSVSFWTGVRRARNPEFRRRVFHVAFPH